MKTNRPHEWQIWLHGRKHTFVEKFEGTLDEALAATDELESGVRFVVHRFEVIRGKRAMPNAQDQTRGE